MKTRLLVPGSSLALFGEDAGEGTASFIDTEWLIHRPHSVLWADEILIAEKDFESALQYFQDDVRRDSIQILFERLERAGVLKTFSPSSVAPSFLSEVIGRQVKEDEERWKIEKPIDPETDRIDMANIRIDGLDICPYRLKSIYSSLAFSRLLNTQCLFDAFEYEVCRRRFGEVLSNRVTVQADLFPKVLDLIAPNIQLLGNYVIHKEECDSCARKAQCASSCVEQTENAISTVLDLRERDEMIQLKKVISESIEDLREGELEHDSGDEETIMLDVQERADKCKRRLLRTFPQVKRWAHITTAISLPLTFAGTAAGSGLVSLLGLGLLGSSQATAEIMRYLQSKYRWVAFLDEIGSIERLQSNPKQSPPSSR